MTGSEHADLGAVGGVRPGSTPRGFARAVDGAAAGSSAYKR